MTNQNVAFLYSLAYFNATNIIISDFGGQNDERTLLFSIELKIIFTPCSYSSWYSAVSFLLLCQNSKVRLCTVTYSETFKNFNLKTHLKQISQLVSTLRWLTLNLKISSFGILYSSYLAQWCHNKPMRVTCLIAGH